jgi:hypothetical protein
MRCRSATWVLAVSGLLIVGCGRSDAPGTAASDSKGAQASTSDPAQAESDSPSEEVAEAAKQQAPPADMNGPEGVTYQFLDAVRLGNDEKAEMMFTKIARQRMKEVKLDVAPKRSDTATFQLGEARYVNDEGAQVTARWTELDQDGKPYTDETVWALHKEPEGWRIAGMATKVFDDREPVMLDFENPQEAMKKLEELRAEIRRQSEKEAPGAQEAENSSESIRR